MSYIGKIPTIGNFQVCDAISTVNAQAAYTMQVDTVNVSPESANHMIVSLNGVIQKPTDAYTVSGSVITFAANLVTGDVIDFIQILGNVLDLGVPSDATVSTAKIVDGAVTSAKLSAGKVLQVVQATHATEVVNSTITYAATGLTASITPISTSNKILILVNQPYSVVHTGGTIAAGAIRLMRDSVTVLLGGDQRYELYSGTTASDATLLGRQDLTYLDSPSTTSSVTYTTELARYQTGDVITTSNDSTVATITLMEVSG